MTRRTCLAALAILALAAGSASTLTAQGRRGQPGRRGGPSGQFATEVPAHPLDVVLARPTGTSMTLSLRSASALTATVAVDPGGIARTVTLAAGAPAEVTLDGLRPDQEYRYTISAATPLAAGVFHTARPAGAPFVFDVQADSHLDENTDVRVYANTLANMRADRADFLVDLGDTFMTDKRPSYQDAAPQYLAQRYYFGLLGMPVFLTLGNHDGETGTRPDMTAWASAMRAKFFPPVTSNAFYSAGPATSAYFTWAWGDARFIVLDPFTPTRARPRDETDGWAWTLGRAQYDWLVKTLETSRAAHTFVFIHHLVGGGTREARGGAEASTFFEWGGANRDGSAGFASQRPGWAMPIHDLLVRHRVTAVLHGHDHLYVRQQRDGLVYLEVPQPGHVRGDQTNSARDYGYASGTLLGSSGHIRVSVSAAQVTLEYVRSRVTGTNADVADRVVVRAAGGAR